MVPLASRLSHLILTAVFLLSCAPTRPVTKIALIAPFEGLYRQTGYTALAAMRAAIAESETGNVAILPLALDGSGTHEQVRRATQKALRDASVKALIGPFDRSAADTVADILAADGRAWYAPTQPVTATVGAIAAHIESERTLVLAGDAELLAQVNAQTLAARLDRPVRVDLDATAPANQDVVIWLGDAAAAADALIALRHSSPETPFWLAINGDTPIFAQRVLRTPAPSGPATTLGPVFWVAWLDDGYPSWAAQHQPNSPTAYVAYRSTQRAIAQILHQDTSLQPERLFVFQLQSDGSSQLVEGE